MSPEKFRDFRETGPWNDDNLFCCSSVWETQPVTYRVPRHCRFQNLAGYKKARNTRGSWAELVHRMSFSSLAELLEYDVNFSSQLESPEAGEQVSLAGQNMITGSCNWGYCEEKKKINGCHKQSQNKLTQGHIGYFLAFFSSFWSHATHLERKKGNDLQKKRSGPTL